MTTSSRPPSPADLAARARPVSTPSARTAPRRPASAPAAAAPSPRRSPRADRSWKTFRRAYEKKILASGMVPTARLVALTLAVRSGPGGQIRDDHQPRLEDLVTETGLSGAQIQTALEILRQRRWLKVTTRQHTDGSAAEDGALIPHGLQISGLDRYSGSRALEAAYQALSDRLYAAGYAEDAASQDYVSDHAAGEIHDALDIASGIPDAALAYGQLAESAVRFVLITPRRDRERELALARAAERAADAPASS